MEMNKRRPSKHGKELAPKTGGKKYPPTKQRKAPKEKSKKVAAESSDEDECFCLVCCEPFRTVHKEKENWIQCVVCHMWSHFDCTDGKESYICHNCDSDSD